MPFTPTVDSFPMPQSKVWAPMQQTSLVAPVTPHVVSASQCFNPLATRKTFHQPSEPLITVFVGNISEEVPRHTIQYILTTFGNIASWKSVKGFGFCEYYQFEDALLAIKVLHDMEVGGKKLVVKVDTKTQKKLDQFEVEKKGTDDSEGNQKLEVHCRERINCIIKKHNDKMIRKEKENENKARIIDGVGFNTVQIEDEKKKLIFEEIDKFREDKKNKEENEIERKKIQEKLNGKHTFPGNPDSEENRIIRSREERDKRYKEKEKTRDKRDESGREKNERTDKEREKRMIKENREEKIPEKSRSYFDITKLQEKEMEELELKKNDDRLREKELAYQKKLNKWLNREKQKKKELSKQRANKQMIEEEREKNAKQLKEFLENYDDKNDDQKYYRGKNWQKRIKLREKEKEEDERDRQKEKDEQVIIPKKVHSNIKLQFSEVLEAREENMHKSKLLMDVAENQKNTLKCYKMDIENQKNMEVEQECQKHVVEKALTPSPQQPATSSNVHSRTPPPEFALISQPTQSITLMIQKNMNIKDVFKNDDEESPTSKKRKLNHIDYCNKIKEKEHKSVEEKKKSISQLIDLIPTDELFSFHLDWTVVDFQMIKKRIWPWINKKIIEYIGEPETTLVDFICSKVEAGSSPQAIIDDVQMVLDDEAEVFVIKIWKLLVYEVEKQKL
ncbi:RNA-binding protein 25-like [Myzus persicae]|uniref:RNA-binding protein 25-like n=1 Tax=Myzus persicae TaxID=13164 RepID=UPI000B938D47|nr:RNA-binding protein 25-like [Myzus persicae]